MTVDDELISSYKEMYELTEPECASCRVQRSCCSPEYCELAEQRATEFGITLEKTDHPRLPYMGEKGCTVPPYLRPLCTLHTCDISSFGFKSNDPEGEWTKKYFDLREHIMELEYKRESEK